MALSHQCPWWGFVLPLWVRVLPGATNSTTGDSGRAKLGWVPGVKHCRAGVQVPGALDSAQAQTPVTARAHCSTGDMGLKSMKEDTGTLFMREL